MKRSVRARPPGARRLDMDLTSPVAGAPGEDGPRSAPDHETLAHAATPPGARHRGTLGLAANLPRHQPVRCQTPCDSDHTDADKTGPGHSARLLEHGAHYNAHFPLFDPNSTDRQCRGRKKGRSHGAHDVTHMAEAHGTAEHCGGHEGRLAGNRGPPRHYNCPHHVEPCSPTKLAQATGSSGVAWKEARLDTHCRTAPPLSAVHAHPSHHDDPPAATPPAQATGLPRSAWKKAVLDAQGLAASSPNGSAARPPYPWPAPPRSPPEPYLEHLSPANWHPSISQVPASCDQSDSGLLPGGCPVGADSLREGQGDSCRPPTVRPLLHTASGWRPTLTPSRHPAARSLCPNLLTGGPSSGVAPAMRPLLHSAAGRKPTLPPPRHPVVRGPCPNLLTGNCDDGSCNGHHGLYHREGHQDRDRERDQHGYHRRARRDMEKKGRLRRSPFWQSPQPAETSRHNHKARAARKASGEEKVGRPDLAVLGRKRPPKVARLRMARGHAGRLHSAALRDQLPRREISQHGPDCDTTRLDGAAPIQLRSICPESFPARLGTPGTSATPCEQRSTSERTTQERHGLRGAPSCRRQPLKKRKAWMRRGQ